MTENEKIEEMARDIDSGGDCMETCCECKYYCYPNCQDVKIAEKLYVKGYRKVERGEWKKREDRRGSVIAEAECSICGREVEYQIINGRWAFEYFCPHCGADMRGKENENSV